MNQAINIASRLRHSETFDKRIDEAIRRRPELNRRVVHYQLDAEELREFAFLVVEATLETVLDSGIDMPGRYHELVDQAIAHRGVDAAVSREYRLLLESSLRYIHARLQVKFGKEREWMALSLNAQDYVNLIMDQGLATCMLVLGAE